MWRLGGDACDLPLDSSGELWRSACQLRARTVETEARYTFGVAHKPEVLEVYPHKTSFRGWAYTFPEFCQRLSCAVRI